MARATIEQQASSIAAGVADAIADTARKAADVKAQLLNTVTAEKVEDRLHATKRALTRGVHQAADIRDAAAHRVKRNPFTAVGASFGAGLLLGVCLGWFGERACRRG